MEGENYDRFKTALEAVRDRAPDLSREKQIKAAVKIAFKMAKNQGLDVTGGSVWLPTDQLPSRKRQSILETYMETDQKAEGIIGDFAKGASRLATKVSGFFAPKGASAKVNNYLRQYGDWFITKTFVARKPINSMIERVVRGVSSNIPYDKLYHLYLIVMLEGPNKELTGLRLERNETFQINVLKKTDIGPDVKRELVSNSNKTKLRDAFERFRVAAESRSSYGAFRYSATENNCQDMVMTWIKANALSSPKIEEFVKQDLKTLIPSVASDVGQVITDVAGAVRQAVGGANQRNPGLIRPRMRPVLNPLPLLV